MTITMIYMIICCKKDSDFFKFLTQKFEYYFINILKCCYTVILLILVKIKRFLYYKQHKF